MSLGKFVHNVSGPVLRINKTLVKCKKIVSEKDTKLNLMCIVSVVYVQIKG